MCNVVFQVRLCCSLLMQIKLMLCCFEFLWSYASSKLIVFLVWEMKADTAVIYTAVVLAFPRRNSFNCVSMCECKWLDVCFTESTHAFTSVCLRACALITQVFLCDSFVTFHRWIPGLLTVVGAQSTRSPTLLLLFPSDNQRKKRVWWLYTLTSDQCETLYLESIVVRNYQLCRPII